MTRRIGRYKKNYHRASRDIFGSETIKLSSPQVCPARPEAERKNARQAADAIWTKVRRRPSSDEVNHGVNMAYWETYPEGPHKIPYSDHECAKRWMKIRYHFNDRIHELMSRSSIKPSAAARPKKRSARVRRRRR
jgi:hypothetical protein